MSAGNASFVTEWLEGVESGWPPRMGVMKVLHRIDKKKVNTMVTNSDVVGN